MIQMMKITSFESKNMLFSGIIFALPLNF